MPDLREFLESANVGVTSSGDALHIGVSFLEMLSATIEGLHLVVPTFAVGEVATIGVATIGGITLAFTGPILGVTGVFMALGSGYQEAREEIHNDAIQSGFSQGFVAGLLRMSKGTVNSLFAKHNVIRTNAFDPEADVIATKAYNRGLVAGYAMGGLPSDDEKKAYLRELRQFTGPVSAGDWGDREKINYVIEYGAKLRKHYLADLNE